MAVKTITIDMEAYGLLSRHKESGQSFSQVIKAHFGREPTAARFRRVLGTVRVSEDAILATERLVAARSADPARATPVAPAIRPRNRPPMVPPFDDSPRHVAAD